MLLNLKELHGHQLAATDGDIGHVEDFYFDDQSWTIRYLVADTGSWLTGRLVLLSPHAFGAWDRVGKTLAVNLTRKQIETSPLIDAHRPVSRQDEELYHRHYGWPVYWQEGEMWGAAGFPFVAPAAKPGRAHHHGHNQRDDLHLRSCLAVTGYDIQATDGPLGAVCGFKVDDQSWIIREIVVETGHWYAGKAIMLLPTEIERISYKESKVFVNLSRAELARTAENKVAKAGSPHHPAEAFPTE